MNKIMRLLRKFLPRDLFCEYQAVVIPTDRRNEISKFFNAGPGKFEFEFIVRQHSVFAVKIGKAIEREGRFEGNPTETIHVDASSQEKPFTLVLSGKDYRMTKKDKWLVKVRAHTFDPKTKNNVLDIYVSEVLE